MRTKTTLLLAALFGGAIAGLPAPRSGAAVPTIRCTPSHRIWRTSDARWVPAAELHPGDRLRSETGEEVVVSSVALRHERARTFNFEVANFHTYFVAADETAPAVLVHNECSVPEGDKLGDMVASSKRSQAGPTARPKNRPHSYEVNSEHASRLRPGKSVLPPNHEQLFLKSKVFYNSKGDPVRWAKVGSGNKAVYHRFMQSRPGVFHWNGSTDGART